MLFYDFVQQHTPAPLRADEFTIDDYLDQASDVGLLAAVDAEGAWVADTLYPGEVTLATLRLRAGLSQKELGYRCGIMQPAIARYEAGAVAPNVFTAAKIAARLGVTMEQLVSALEQTAAKARA